MRTLYVVLICSFLMGLHGLPAVHAALMNDYCVKPPFIQPTIQPNLLLMIDNSGSMFDLAYADKGMRHCSATTTTGCFFNSDCPNGETCGGPKHCSVTTSKSCTSDTDCSNGDGVCSNFDRIPSYCFDETYSNTNVYAGYFDSAQYYYYRSGSDDFALVTSPYPSGCPTSSTNTTKTITNTMCLEYTASGALVSFVAKGSYLNWLSASKFDVEKQILTGGKYDGSGLVAESRGCVGQGFVKNALTTDFVNYTGGPTNDPNFSLGVTFTVTGPDNVSNPSAPSPGGQTYINLFAGKTYNLPDCQNAINALA